MYSRVTRMISCAILLRVVSSLSIRVVRRADIFLRILYCDAYKAPLFEPDRLPWAASIQRERELAELSRTSPHV